MISYIKGRVLSKGSDYIIADTKGVGYKVFVAENLAPTFSLDEEVELYCHLHFRKDETLELYGTDSPESLELFETLNNISGIGPKAALTISSLGSMEELKAAISKGDTSFFQSVKGIGQKKIQKVMLELTGKFAVLAKGGEKKEDTDAVDALVALGFSRQKARAALSQVPQSVSSLEEKVKQALKVIKR
tara:strand:+ start:3619 stop:4185 length:567 start_codon:yes stop_codon:yes gene_type:complete